MRRGNQFLLYFLILLLLGALVAYMFYFRKKVEDFLPAAFAVPPSAIAVYQGTDWNDDYTRISRTTFYRNLLVNKQVENFDKELHFFDSLYRKDETFRQILSGEPLLVSLHSTSATSLGLLFMHQSNGLFNRKDILRLANDFAGEIEFSHHNYKEVKITQVRKRSKENLFSFAIADGIVLLSRNSVLVEEAITAYEQNRSKSEPFIEQIVQARQKNRLFFNYKSLPDFLSTWVAVAQHEELQKMKNLAYFASYTWKVDDNKMVLDGTINTTQLTDMWYALQDQKPVQMNVADVLPQSSSLYFNWGVSDFREYYKNYVTYLKNNALLNDYNSKKERLQSEQGIAIDSAVFWAGQEWAYVLMEPVNENVLLEEVLVVKPYEAETALQTLTNWKNKIEERAQAGFVAEEYKGYKIEHTRFGYLFELLFGGFFQNLQEVYYTQIGDYLFFSAQPHVLYRSIDAFTANQTLGKTHASHIKENFATKANFFAYVNPSRSTLIGSRYVRSGFLEQFKLNSTYYSNFGSIGYQLIGNGPNLVNRIVASQQNVQVKTSEFIWRAMLENEAVGKPYIISSGVNSSKDILVFDKANQMYFINNSGNIIWKRKIEEPVIGEVSTIDFYKNGKVQFLFNTAKRIYLIDREGRDVGNYPLKLGVDAKYGHTIYEDDQTRSISYYVAAAQGRVYGFSLDGKPLSGWNPMMLDAPLQHSLKYFVSNNEAYFFGISEKGKLYLWNRLGKQQMQPIAVNSQFMSPFKLNFGVSFQKHSLFSIDTAGYLTEIWMDGSIKKRRFSGFTNSPYFDFIDTDGNGKKEYILVQGARIAAYENDTNAVWKINTVSPLSDVPQFFTLNGITYLGYTSGATQQIILVSRAGTFYPGFPLGGNTPFEIDDLNGDVSKELVVGGEGKTLYLYRLN